MACQILLSFRSQILLTPFRNLRFASHVDPNRSSASESPTERTDQIYAPIVEPEVDVSGGILSKIDINPEIQAKKVKLLPEKFDDAKLLHIAIVGKTNSGKSALTNALTGATVSAVSKKIHTTRKITKGILVNNKTQLIFLDTPGFFTGNKKKKQKIELELYRDQEQSLKMGEIILVLHDVSNEYTCKRLDSRILHLLYRYKHLPAILVLNKIDALKSKSKILDIIHNLTKSRVNEEILQRKVTKIIKTAADFHENKKKSLTEIVAHYKAKRTLEEKILEEKRLLKESIGVLPTISESKKDLNFASTNLTEKNEKEEDKNAIGNDGSEKFKFDKKLWTVDYETLEKIADKALHEIPLNQLRKCYLNEQGWPYFKAVFSISALCGDGIERLADFLVKSAKPNNWRYHSSVITPANPTELAKESVRSKMLDILPYDNAYKLTYQIVVWEVNEHDTLCILMNVNCRSPSQISAVFGPDKRNVIAVSRIVSQDLSNLFGREVYVKLNVKCPKIKQ